MCVHICIGSSFNVWVSMLDKSFWSTLKIFEKILVITYSLSKKLYSHCLVLVGSRNGYERDLHKQIIACFTIELKQISINYTPGRPHSTSMFLIFSIHFDFTEFTLYKIYNIIFMFYICFTFNVITTSIFNKFNLVGNFSIFHS